jgi:PAS domain S-box-containing protein
LKQISTSSVVTPDFRLLFESAPALCLVLDPDFHIVAASNSYLSATMTQRDQILGRDIFEVFPDNPGDSAATGVANLKTSLQRVVRDKVPDAMAVQKYDIARPATAGGGFEERYWSPINSPVSSGDRLLFIIHMVEDVTELVHLKRLGSEHEKMFEELQSHVGRTEAEVVHRARQVQDTNARLARANEELRQSEELLRMVVDGAKGYAIFVLDTQGRIKTWSAAAQRIKGYSAQEIIGQHISRFYLPQDVQRGKPQAALREALEKGSYEDEGWRVRKDGSRFWANVAISCIRDSRGTHIGFSKITRDLTERKRVEEERDQFFNLSLDMLCIADFNGYFKRVNPAFTRVLGYTPEEMMARPWAEFLHPGDTDRTSAEYGRNALGKESVEFENRYRCKDGTYKWLSWVALPIVEQKRIYAAARDVTERRQADERIRSLNQELTRHTAELEAASSELESFSYSVSHDLRAPLRSLDGFSQALLEDYADKLDNEGKDHLRRIRASSQRMG